jgi:hypothetical protein
MAVTILAIMMWLSRELAAPIPPTEPIYQGSTFEFVLNRTSF